MFGWILAHAPEGLLRAGTALLGDFIFFCLPSRRRLILANLHHAFPGKTAAWRNSIGRESCRRLIETGLLSLAIPFLPESRIRAIVRASPSLPALFADYQAAPRATLICAPHLAHWEVQTALPLLVKDCSAEFGSLFRPLDNPAADAWIKQTRERFGMKLLSRKAGFQAAMGILRRNGLVGVLFDQNAGLQGALTLLLDRVCSTTELAGLLSAKFKAQVCTIHPRRLGFWRVELVVERLETDGTVEGITVTLNRWLERTLQADDNICASWLWAHGRWKNQDMPSRRLRLEAKRNFLAVDLKTRGLATLPRRTRVWVRLPNWLGDVVLALPLLRALRSSRPDAEISLLAKPHFLPLLKDFAVADRLIPLPKPGRGYWSFFWRLRGEYPDTWLLFTNSFRGDLEAWFAGCRQRFGIRRRGQSRPFLSHSYRVPPEFDERQHHQFELWADFLQYFGLNTAPDRTPVGTVLTPDASRSTPDPSSLVIGLIPGSENAPQKRWPVAHWRTLITALAAAHANARFVLFGTAGDCPTADAIVAGLGAPTANLAGRTDLRQFVAKLQGCRLLVSNDTGGMHLANALGVPLIALFGPTNPRRTGPIFQSPVRILQPPGCPSTGGAALADLPPATVVAAADAFIAGRFPAPCA